MDQVLRKRRGRTLLAAGSLVGTLVTLAPACGSVHTGIGVIDCYEEDGGINPDPACEAFERNSPSDPDAGAKGGGRDAG